MKAPPRESVIAAGEKYIFRGILAHRPEEVPLAEDCVRTELGMVTGASGAELREILRSPAYDAVQDIRNLRWIVEGEQAVVFYEQTLAFAPDPLLVCTRFRVTDGLIREIEILLYCKGMTDAIAQNIAQLAP